MAPQSRAEIHGHAEAGFEAVRLAFADNFLLRRELGAACCSTVRRSLTCGAGFGIRPTERPGPRT